MHANSLGHQFMTKFNTYPSSCCIVAYYTLTQPNPIQSHQTKQIETMLLSDEPYFMNRPASLTFSTTRLETKGTHGLARTTSITTLSIEHVHPLDHK